VAEPVGAEVGDDERAPRRFSSWASLAARSAGSQVDWKAVWLVDTALPGREDDASPWRSDERLLTQEVNLVPYERDPQRDAQVQELQELSPQQGLERLLARLEKPPDRTSSPKASTSRRR
jgi:hypothetical protein